MSHALEISPEGKASFVSLREFAWHGLGTIVSEAKTTAEMLTLANLAGWNVRTESLPDHFKDWNFRKDIKLVVRDNPFGGGIDVLGDVGGRYEVFSNEDMFTFCSQVLEGAGTWETMGSIDGGVRVFGCMSMDMEDIILDPTGANDRVSNFLMCTTTHDGTGAVKFALTPVRIVCKNTLNMAMDGIKTSYSIKHTPGAAAKREDCQAVLGIATKQAAWLAEEAKELFETSIIDQQFYDLCKAVYAEPEADAEKGAHKKWETKMDELQDIYHGPTCTTIKGTAWGALNAMTERLDWGRKARKGKDENTLAAASGFNDLITKDKTAIYYAVRDLLVDA